MHQGRPSLCLRKDDALSDDAVVEVAEGSPVHRLNAALESVVLGQVLEHGVRGVTAGSIFLWGMRVAVQSPEYAQAWASYVDALAPEYAGDRGVTDGLMEGITITELEAYTVAASQ